MATGDGHPALTKLLVYAQSCARNDLTGYKNDAPERSGILALRDALFVGAKKVPGSSKKRKRTEDLNRPCSPSLFSSAAPVPYSNGNSASKRLDLSDKLESALSSAVTPLFDRPTSVVSADPGDKLVPAHRYTSLGYLLLPIRRPSVLDHWSAQDIAVFEAAICVHGKKFDTIKSLLPHKTTKEVVDFYYVWKHTSHKPTWKRTFRPVE